MGNIAKARINEAIEADEVRLITENGEQAGIVSLEDALNAADDAGLDLVEVSPNGKPPVCRIMNHGKAKYEAQKKAHESKKKQHVIKFKEIRFRPRIEEHDLMTKINRARKFINEGFKLKVTIMYRGREMVRQDLGLAVLDQVKELMEDIAVVEKENGLEGRRLSIIMSAK
ncbi:MAG: translation initiation factor IF-3 [Candidatus Marinimicrobia bacterium]|nr:translation initiation factor IF-3 [Candidatus Neomarinimicrobiota bacterium]